MPLLLLKYLVDLQSVNGEEYSILFCYFNMHKMTHAYCNIIPLNDFWGHHLLIWINSNHSMDKKSDAQ